MTPSTTVVCLGVAGEIKKRSFYVTFGQRYRIEEHPILGYVPTLPDQWVRIEAHDETAARALAGGFFGQKWSGLYEHFEEDKELYPEGEFAVIRMNKTSGWVLERTEAGDG